MLSGSSKVKERRMSRRTRRTITNGYDDGGQLAAMGDLRQDHQVHGPRAIKALVRIASLLYSRGAANVSNKYKRKKRDYEKKGVQMRSGEIE
jgi:hypothetical protein